MVGMYAGRIYAQVIYYYQTILFIMTKMCMRCGYKVRDDVEICPLCKVNFEEIVPEKVGLLGNKSKQREIEDKFEKESGLKISDLKEELHKQHLLNRYNLHKGLKFRVYLPEEEIVLKQHSGLTKGIVTYAFGLPGMAAISGVKQEKKQKTIKTVLQAVDAGIIFINASKDGKDIRIPFEHIVSFKNKGEHFTLTLLENQKLELYLNEFTYDQKKKRGSELNYIYDHITETISSKATGNQNVEELKWNPDLKNNNSEIISKTKEENSSLMNELERLGNMYEKGLLTDEEFAAMKKKLIDDGD